MRFKTVEEINKKAEALREKEDEKGLVELAKENGLDQEDAEDFFDEVIDELATPLTAGLGRLKVESEELKLTFELENYLEIVKQMCLSDVKMQAAVLTKPLVGVLGKILKEASNKRVLIPEAITKAAGLQGKIYTGTVSKAEAKKIIEQYYMGE